LLGGLGRQTFMGVSMAKQLTWEVEIHRRWTMADWDAWGGTEGHK